MNINVQVGCVHIIIKNKLIVPQKKTSASYLITE